MKSRFVKLPNAVLEDSRLGKSELAVFACLHALSGNVYMGEKQVKASRKLIASYCNISVKTVTKAVKKLRELGYIKKIRQYFVDAHKLGTYIYILNVVKGTKYFFVSRDVFKMGLSVTQLYVYMFCCKCADSKTRRFWNSYNDISDKLGISRSGAINTVAQLVEMKLITQIKIIKKNGSYSDNHYRECEGKNTQKEEPSCGCEGSSAVHNYTSIKSYRIYNKPVLSKCQAKIFIYRG